MINGGSAQSCNEKTSAGKPAQTPKYACCQKCVYWLDEIGCCHAVRRTEPVRGSECTDLSNYHGRAPLLTDRSIGHLSSSVTYRSDPAKLNSATKAIATAFRP